MNCIKDSIKIVIKSAPEHLFVFRVMWQNDSITITGLNLVASKQPNTVFIWISGLWLLKKHREALYERQCCRDCPPAPSTVANGFPKPDEQIKACVV